MTVSLTWTAPNGVATELMDPANGIDVMRSPLGLDAPSVDLIEEGAISSDGSVLLARRYTPRMVALPLLVQSARVRDLTGDLIRAFVGPGELTWNDGSVYRTLRKVHYSGGLDSVEIINGTESTLVTTVLRALDPFWYGGEETYPLNIGESIEFDDAAVAFDDAAILFDGGDSTPSFVVGGDADAFPRFAITGAFTELAVGIAGGLQWELVAPLASGDVITIDANPGSRGPALNGGSIDWSLLTPESRLFSLPPQATTTLFVAAGGVDGSSAVVLSFEPRYLTL